MRDMFEGDDDLLRRYLLGELSEEEEAGVEDRLLQENRLFRRAELIEGELLAEYARGELTPAQRERIRLWSASPGGRARLALAQGLTTIGPEPRRGSVGTFPPAPAPVRPWYRSVLPLAACFLLFVGSPAVWLAWHYMDEADEVIVDFPAPPPPAPPRAPVETPRTGPTPPPVQAQATPPPGVPEQVVTQAFALAFTTTTRSAGESEEDKVLSIKEETEEVDFQVELDAAGEGPYEVTLTTSGDEEVFQEKSLRLVSLDSGKRGIRFEVPADDLPEGGCTITVQDTNAADTMPLIQSFEIRKQS